MTGRTRETPALIAVTVVAASVCALGPDMPWLRVPFALILLLALPGYAIARALFPEADQDPVRLALLTVGLSLAVAVIAGVEMAAFGVLSSRSWAISSAFITIGAACIAHRRARLRSIPSRRPRAGVTRRGRGALITIALATLIVLGAATALALTPLPVPDDRGYTVLSVSPSSAPSGFVTISIESEEAAAREFLLVVAVERSVALSRSVTLQPGARLEQRVNLPPPGTRGAVRAVLIDRSGPLPSVYRRVRLTLPVQGPAPVITNENQ
jgi:hypothetical protein